MSVTALAVPDMHCGACQQKVGAALSEVPAVSTVRFNDLRRRVIVEHDEELPSSALISALEELGFQPSLLSDADGDAIDSELLKRFGIAALCAMQVMMAQFALYSGFAGGMDEAFRRLLEYAALMFTIPVVAYSALPFYWNGLALARRGLNMDTPIAIAVLVAFAVSFYNTLAGVGETYYDSVVMFTVLMLGSRLLERRLRFTLTVEEGILAGLPRSATFVVEDRFEDRAVGSIAKGDRLWVGEGDMFPADAVLVSTEAITDEAPLTGESEWQTKKQGDRLFAGTYNRGPGIEVEAVGALGDAYLAQIDHLSRAAFDRKHRLSNLADRVAQVFVPTILLLSAGTYFAWTWIDPAVAVSAALAVLVVSCPCALSLAVPAARTAALARLRQLGVLVKNSRALELLPRIADVVFDKTGTLTHGLRVARVLPLSDWDADLCLEIAGAIQHHSAHALARAFPAARTRAVSEVTTHGRGVEANVDGHNVRIGSADFCEMRESSSALKTIYMSVDDVPAAVFEIEQALREGTEEAVRWFVNEGVDVSISSGDDEMYCRPIAESLGVRCTAHQRPQDKVDAIDASGMTTMFVGDGINDIPALASASVSVSTMETSDLVKSKADAILLTSRLSALVDLARVAKRCRRVMLQNLAWAGAYNVLAIPVAALGYAPPWVAALGMSLSSLLVLGNAGRVLRAGRSDLVGGSS